MRILGLIVALWAAVLLPTKSFALGLGEIEVNSFLNQPLDAEIQVISARPGEIDDLLVSLASREAFTRAGLARTRNLSELRFTVKKNEEGTQAVILVTTKGSVKEPFLNFLIEADWSKGRVLREFTVLLDPPFYADQPAPVESASQPVEQPVVEEASVSEIAEQSGVTPIAETSEPAVADEMAEEPIATTEETSPVPETQTESVGDTAAVAEPEPQYVMEGDVTVSKGNTLWGIAKQFKDQDHSMAQVMLAFQRANPDAFNDGNINHLKVGAVLRAPSAEELDALGQQEAYAEVLVQNGLWDEYVARVTGVSPAVASDAGVSETVSEEDTTDTGGELSLLLPGEGDSESTGTGDTSDEDALRTRLALAEEELEASRIENQELESRIAELQARLSKVEELQKMVEIEDDSLAQIQADQAEQEEMAEAGTEGQVDDEATSGVAEAIQADEVQADEEALLEELLAEENAAEQAGSEESTEGSMTEDSMADDSMADDSMADESMTDDTLAEDIMVEESSTETAGTDEMTEEVEADTAAPTPAVVPQSAMREPSIFDGILPPDVIDMIPSLDAILGDPIILGAVGGLILLLLILVVLKRRKSSEEDESGISASGDDDLFAAEDDDELTPIHLADGAADAAPDAIEVEETDIKIPDEDDIVPEESPDELEEGDLAETSVMSAVDAADADVSTPAAGDQDDVLNEVDVYLAYGLYDNAEDLLNSNLTEHPERADYRSKLLDTYFATKNVEGFSREAEKLKSMGDAANNYWDRVQIMGYELAPDNPLFSDAKDSGLSAADLEITKPQEADFDLGASDDDDTNFSTTDFNLGEEDTGGEFSDTSNMGEAGEIAATQQIPKIDEVPAIHDSTEAGGSTEASAEAESDTALELPDEVGDELEFSMEEESTDNENAEVELPDDLDLDPAADSDATALDEMPMDFDIADDEAAQEEDKSEVDFGTEIDDGSAEDASLELDVSEAVTFDADSTDTPAAELESDEDAVELDTDSDNQSAADDTAIGTPGEVDDDSTGASKDDTGIDLGMEDTAMIDLNEEVALSTGEINLETQELSSISIEDDLDDDEDISIIDFGGEDFVEPTDIIESVDDGEDATALSDDEGDSERTGTFAPGDFDEPTAAVSSVADMDDIGDLMLPDDVDEVSTKLDLARAFIDMGDTEGARGSLEEVLTEGNDEQKAEATALLEQI